MLLPEVCCYITFNILKILKPTSMKNSTRNNFSFSAFTKSFGRMFRGIFFTTSNEDFKRLKNFIC